MDTVKVNKLRRLVKNEIESERLFRQTSLQNYWRGVHDMLFVVLQLQYTGDCSTAEDLLANLKQHEPGQHGSEVEL